MQVNPFNQLSYQYQRTIQKALNQKEMIDFISPEFTNCNFKVSNAKMEQAEYIHNLGKGILLILRLVAAPLKFSLDLTFSVIKNYRASYKLTLGQNESSPSLLKAAFASDNFIKETKEIIRCISWSFFKNSLRTTLSVNDEIYINLSPDHILSCFPNIILILNGLVDGFDVKCTKFLETDAKIILELIDSHTNESVNLLCDPIIQDWISIKGQSYEFKTKFASQEDQFNPSKFHNALLRVTIDSYKGFSKYEKEVVLWNPTLQLPTYAEARIAFQALIQKKSKFVGYNDPSTARTSLQEVKLLSDSPILSGPLFDYYKADENADLKQFIFTFKNPSLKKNPTKLIQMFSLWENTLDYFSEYAKLDTIKEINRIFTPENLIENLTDIYNLNFYSGFKLSLVAALKEHIAHSRSIDFVKIQSPFSVCSAFISRLEGSENYYFVMIYTTVTISYFSMKAYKISGRKLIPILNTFLETDSKIQEYKKETGIKLDFDASSLPDEININEMNYFFYNSICTSLESALNLNQGARKDSKGDPSDWLKNLGLPESILKHIHEIDAIPFTPPPETQITKPKKKIRKMEEIRFETPLVSLPTKPVLPVNKINTPNPIKPVLSYKEKLEKWALVKKQKIKCSRKTFRNASNQEMHRATVSINKVGSAIGESTSKRMAEQEAAKNLLAKIENGEKSKKVKKSPKPSSSLIPFTSIIEKTPLKPVETLDERVPDIMPRLEAPLFKERIELESSFMIPLAITETGNVSENAPREFSKKKKLKNLATKAKEKIFKSNVEEDKKEKIFAHTTAKQTNILAQSPVNIPGSWRRSSEGLKKIKKPSKAFSFSKLNQTIQNYRDIRNFDYSNPYYTSPISPLDNHLYSNFAFSGKTEVIENDRVEKITVQRVNQITAVYVHHADGEKVKENLFATSKKIHELEEEIDLLKHWNNKNRKKIPGHLIPRELPQELPQSDEILKMSVDASSAVQALGIYQHTDGGLVRVGQNVILNIPSKGEGTYEPGAEIPVSTFNVGFDPTISTFTMNALFGTKSFSVEHIGGKDQEAQLRDYKNLENRLSVERDFLLKEGRMLTDLHSKT